jgi:hypothetical protein
MQERTERSKSSSPSPTQDLEMPKDCDECKAKGMTWGCYNGDMPCPWGVPGLGWGGT